MISGGYLGVKLDEDETPDEMYESLVADRREKIPENMSECMKAQLFCKSFPHYPLIDVRLDFYWLP